MEISRLDDMLGRYGECCNQTRAAQILGVTARTVYRMMEDGRLRRIGSSVDVRSIAHYLENPRKRNFVARVRPSKRKSMWSDFGKIPAL